MAQTKDSQVLARAIIVSQFAPPFMLSGVAVALPGMGADLAAGAISLGLVETLILAGTGAFLLPIGRLADAGDKRTIYKLGLLGLGLSSLLIGVLSSMPAILLLRFLQGAASASIAAAGPSILGDLVPAEKRGRAFGSSLGAIYAGLTLGPIASGFLVHAWGWRAVFLGGAAALLVGYLVMRVLMPSAWRRPERPIHLPSTVLVVGAVLSLVAASSLARLAGWLAVVCLTAGVALVAWFVRWQRRLDRPLLDVGALMANRILRDALFVQLLLYMNAFCSVFMLSLYMQVSLGHSAPTAGQVLAIGTVLMAATAPVAGRLADRFHPGRISTAGVACVLLSALGATTLDAASGLTSVIAILAIQGLGYALFSSSNMTLIMNSVPGNAMSMASALAAMGRSLGMVSGMLVTALLISLYIGNDPIADHPLDFIETMTTAFSVLATVTTAALLVCLRTRTHR